ncbi:phosphoglycerate mutase [Arboricoccus pini]|uniref:2,3-bisphosphoglycerate-dependent phosphoglycerate mutase n=1 Tax=Arboricoccus pini TaxID=1963835 RepID=A0A212RS33_9PROT|nr:2,3-diphosphoglycerate-dependent phosphoglycerate mutase [Arboricoccus pini]SNB75272.1 phosphoglycerate mutase [Arboricoccus pini]
MRQLVLLRHGQSTWNRENRFTGWTDVDLSEQGHREAERAAEQLRRHHLAPSICYTSYLRRAIRTLWIVQEQCDWMWLPTRAHWRLNERHYGALQGLNKAEAARDVGEAQVHLWRRSFDVAPPPLPDGDTRLPDQEARYRAIGKEAMPRAESLKDTIARTLPYWEEAIAPALRAGQTPLVVAHGNSLRGLVKYLDGIADDAIVDLEIPTGQPLVYELDDALHPLRHYYLRDLEDA